MDALYCYRYFHSVQLHFKQINYDFKKYGLNRKRFSVDDFNNEKGKAYQCQALAEEYSQETFERLTYCNLFIDPSIWVGDLRKKEGSHQAWDNYLWCKKYNDSMQKYFLDEVKYLREKYGSINDANIFREIMNKEIHPETISILSKFKNSFRKETLNKHRNIIYETVEQRLVKYDAFVSIPDVEYLNSLKENLKTLLLR